MKIAMCLQLFFDDKGAYIYEGTSARQFREALSHLNGEVVSRYGRSMYFVTIDDLCHDGSFSMYYTLRGIDNNVARFDRVNQRLTPDIVINRRKDSLYMHHYFATAPWFVYNAPEIAQLGNKSVCLERFAQYMPKSYKLARDDGAGLVQVVLDQNPDVFQWIIKPLRLNGGRGIDLVGSEEVVASVARRSEDIVLQEFCETESVVPSLHIDGRHDVRVYIIDSQPLLVAIREPQPGGYLANTSAGGSIRFAQIENLPIEALDMVRTIASEITNINERYFVSIDIFFTGGTWKLIEINDQPGLPAKYQTPQAEIVVKKLVDSWEGMCKQ